MRSVRTLCLTIGAVALIGRAGGAQAPTGGETGRTGATRGELEQLAASAESAALRERLTEGDFRPGDHIVLTVPADSALSDTFVVRGGGPAGPVLRLPNLPEIPLRGVLRSELQPHLVAHVGRFLKDTVLRVTVLIPIGVLGELARPGYYRVPIDLPFSDIIMAAGGPTPSADLTRITVRRGSSEFLARSAARAAMTQGLTLDELGLAPGDEVLVGTTRRERKWETILRNVSVVGSLVLSLVAVGALGGR
ncbi:MAG: SLBB domain-containing protein [Gemmatimonadota bacterium]|nr:SLBB domain-containing protein [Gemmatimonadota bacterium]